MKLLKLDLSGSKNDNKKPAPSKITIITYTITTNIGTSINLPNFGKYCILEKGYVEKIKAKDENGKIIARSLEGTCSFKLFSNQATAIIPTNDKAKNINIKVFRNGELQMTGCRNKKDASDVLTKLVKTIEKSIETANENIIADYYKLKESKLKICMINSKFSINFSVNRDNLFNLFNTKLLNEILSVKYDPSKHQGVNIKLISKNNCKITIIVFQNGKVLITGVKSEEDMLEGYNYLNNKINQYYQDIIY